jgi:unsaturated rhamnogalacturonyl hydrolase
MVFRLVRTFALLLLAAALPAAAQQVPNRFKTLDAMKTMADWQLAHLDDLSYIPARAPSTSNPRDWQQAAFWVALTAVADRSKGSRFRDALVAKGAALDWKPGDRIYHADDHIIGAAWLWAADRGAGDAAVAPIRARFDQVLAAPRNVPLTVRPEGSAQEECWDRWCWCDALFMAPPTWWALGNATGDPRYAEFAHKEFVATTELLFDKGESLYYRDSRFFDRRGAHGEKLFWSRGNGWVFSGLARLIPLIDAKDPRRPYYVDLFRKMAAKLVTLQRPNGYWPPSLLGDPASAPDETSGTGFFVHGLGWGIEAGILDRKTYLPAVLNGWAALQRAIQPDGRLGWVQQVSDRPEAVKAEDTQFYGVGAYLLAGSAVYDLGKR